LCRTQYSRSHGIELFLTRVSTIQLSRLKLTLTAHTIQNAQSQLAQACCALQAERRWAITGTPIQNKLTDFSSILKFLQVYPYDDQKIFDEEISHPWHLANREGFLRLKSLVRAITISRTKTVIKLPARVDEIHHLEFSSEESDGYNAAKKETIALFEEAISSNKQGGKTFNALTRLNFLRIFCNLGLWCHKKPNSAIFPAFGDCGNSFTKSDVCDSFYSNILDGSARCTQCGQALLEDLLEGMSRPDFDCSPNITRMPSLCDTCKSDSSSHQSDLTPFFQREQSDVSAASSAPSTPSNQTQTLLPLESIPTKIKTLVADLSTHCPTEKWYEYLPFIANVLIPYSVVFSFWTSTLDLVQHMLDESEFIYTRIDGKISLAKRTECMRLFQTDDTVRVILVSITCGGAG
jgi:SWI/SNF-related matrix-associated actin-dependent regulator of chromatin subfamily A3